MLASSTSLRLPDALGLATLAHGRHLLTEHRLHFGFGLFFTSDFNYFFNFDLDYYVSRFRQFTHFLSGVLNFKLLLAGPTEPGVEADFEVHHS